MEPEREPRGGGQRVTWEIRACDIRKVRGRMSFEKEGMVNSVECCQGVKQDEYQ